MKQVCGSPNAAAYSSRTRVDAATMALTCPYSLNSDVGELGRQASLLRPSWYAVFTLAHHEKRVLERCRERQVESFLPLYRTRRKWKNGSTVDLELPLFPNYFFVRIVPPERTQVLRLPGVLSIVSSRGQLLPIADDHIMALRDGLLVYKIEPHPNVVSGESVRITTGPLAGAEGVFDRHKNGLRVLLKLEMLGRTISVEVGAHQIEFCRSETLPR